MSLTLLVNFKLSLHDIAATCVFKMPLNPNHPSILLCIVVSKPISVMYYKIMKVIGRTFVDIDLKVKTQMQPKMKHGCNEDFLSVVIQCRTKDHLRRGGIAANLTDASHSE